jgi:ComF family protein
MTAYQLKRSLVSIVYPNRCPFCNAVIAPDEFYCAACPRLTVYDNTNRDTFFCAYDDFSKPLLNAAKENADGYAISAAAKLLHDALAQNVILPRIDIVTSIPGRKSALRERGYNFPSLLAREIAQLSGKKYAPKMLKLLRETDEQKDLNAAERAENLKGAFGIRREAAGLSVLIVDDVCTTGATLGEAQRLLAEYANEVYIAAFAKTM